MHLLVGIFCKLLKKIPVEFPQLPARNSFRFLGTPEIFIDKNNFNIYKMKEYHIKYCHMKYCPNSFTRQNSIILWQVMNNTLHNLAVN
jgi:hypothetical protein